MKTKYFCPECDTEIRFPDPVEHAKFVIAAEDYYDQVEQEKEKLKAKKPWFPWRISITRIA